MFIISITTITITITMIIIITTIVVIVIIFFTTTSIITIWRAQAIFERTYTTNSIHTNKLHV